MTENKTENKEDTLVRSFATLSSLRKNIGEMTGYKVLETYVNEFHRVLDRCEAIGIDVTEFRIPDSEVTPVDISGPIIVDLDSGSRITPPHYSKQKYVNKSFVLMKLDAILGYLERLTSEKPRKIGFRKHDTEN